MKIYPIYHSGFMVELKNHLLLFDYYRKDLPITHSEKPLYIFVSHQHEDHYNPDIFELTKDFKNRTFIFADEIQNCEKDVLYMGPDETRRIDDLTVSTLKSTDRGVAFIIEVENKTIYHAGDLHLWLWEDDSEAEAEMMRSSFMSEMNKIEGHHFDLAFLVLDPRQSDELATQGMDIFNEWTDTSVVFPMHFSSDPERMEKLLLKLNYSQNIVNTERVKNYEF